MAVVQIVNSDSSYQENQVHVIICPVILHLQSAANKL